MTIPNSDEVGTLCHSVNQESNDFEILLNLYSTEYTAKTRSLELSICA